MDEDAEANERFDVVREKDGEYYFEDGYANGHYSEEEFDGKQRDVHSFGGEAAGPGPSPMYPQETKEEFYENFDRDNRMTAP